MFEIIISLSIIVFACLVVFSDNLRRAITYSGVFSILMAVGFLIYNSPDIALAEASIGAGLTTLLYLITLKNISLYEICYVNEDVETFNDTHLNEIRNSLLRPLELFLEKTEEVEPQLVYTNHSVDELLRKERHDCIVHRKGDMTYIYGDMSNDIFQDLVANLDDIFPDLTNIRVIHKDEVSLNGTNDKDE